MSDNSAQPNMAMIQALGEGLRARIVAQGEETLAFQNLIGAISKLEHKTQWHTAHTDLYNEFKLVVVEGQIDQYAEKYDQIERSMRHYG